MYVCNRFTIEMYRFMHSLLTSLACAAHDAITMEVDSVQIYGRWLTAQQKDERRQDNGDKKCLAHQHSSNLLRSLTHEWDR